MHYHFICKVVEDKKIVVQYILTRDNVSNIFTKLLAKANSGNSLSYWGCA